MSEPSTWATVHAGDVILGHDGAAWFVAEIDREAARGAWRVVVQLGDEAVVGYPTPWTPVFVVRRSDTAPEMHAAGALLALGGVEIRSERWENNGNQE